MSTPAESIERPEAAKRSSELLAFIASGLLPEERDRFGLELLDAARTPDGPFHHVLESWLMTVLMRRHPDFELQRKEIGNLERSGELFRGLGRKGLEAR
jgi:hypothetical protein